ncbi:MAG: FmdB family transcriptional regulator [Actinomycetota bacterium]|nr:FmdB family transcriptional regulator [Actinomycetota bacterium]MDA3018690.1 FmdB family transcriptional regulator [Actinomycetota bacterium]
MPIYVYKFTDTGETIEVHQAFTDDALIEYPHPSDGAVRPVKKVFQPVGVTFKGGGFYKTDSRGGSSSTTPSTSTTAASDTSSTATPAATPATPSPSVAPSSAPSTPA